MRHCSPLFLLLFAIVSTSIAGTVLTRRPNIPIPDGNLNGVADTIVTPGMTITNVQVRMDTLFHTWVGDLVVFLTSPRGDLVTIMSSPGPDPAGSNSDNFIFTIISDTATRSIESINPVGDPPHTGHWQNDPQPPNLSAFNGVMPAGNWVLSVRDVAAFDVGTLVRWSLIIATDTFTTPAITHASLRTTFSLLSRKTTAVISDPQGIASGPGGPRLWHKSSALSTYLSTPADSTRGTTYYFTIPAYPDGVTVQYYIAAQDASPNNSVATLPAGGSGVNPPGSAAPSVVFSYLISSNIIEITEPIFVGPQDGSLQATIYVPPPLGRKGVGVVLGHYSGADRHTAHVWCDTFAARGYTAMTFDYYDFATDPFGYYPQPVRVFKLAVEYLRRNAAEFGVSTGRIVAFGQSQGSIAWGQTITWDNADSLFGTDPAINDRVDAAILLYGGYDMFNYWGTTNYQLLTTYFSHDSSLRRTRGNPIANYRSITSPVLLMHDTGDQVVPFIHSQILFDSLNSIGRVCQLVPFFTGIHVFDITVNGFRNPAGLIAKDSVLSFIGRHVPLTSVGEDQVNPPTAFKLEQNYPNPFNPITTIQYEIPTAGHVVIGVYDILGREVKTLVNEHQLRGRYQSSFNAGGLASGVYFYRIRAGEFAATRKLMLLR